MAQRFLGAIVGEGWGAWAQEIYADLGLRFDGDKAELNNIPHEAMKGAKLTEVGLMEGATTGGGVSRNDYAIKTEGGHTLHIPRSTTNQGVLELLKELGVDISGAQK